MPANDSQERRRLLLLAALVLAGVSLVGLGAGYLLSVTDDYRAQAAGRTPSPSPSGSASAPAATSPAPSRSRSTVPSVPAPRRTVRAASQVERGRTTDLGYVLGARSARDGVHVTFDRVQRMTGRQAEDYAISHGLDPSLARLSGVVVNDNPRTRDLVLAPDVKVFGGVRLAASSDLEPVPLQTLLDALPSQGGSLTLGLTYDQLGYVIKVEEKRFA
jgi:hypothetical protein